MELEARSRPYKLRKAIRRRGCRLPDTHIPRLCNRNVLAFEPCLDFQCGRHVLLTRVRAGLVEIGALLTTDGLSFSPPIGMALPLVALESHAGLPWGLIPPHRIHGGAGCRCLRWEGSG